MAYGAERVTHCQISAIQNRKREFFIFLILLQESHHSEASIETIDPNESHNESLQSSCEESQVLCLLDFCVLRNEANESSATLILTEEWTHM